MVLCTNTISSMVFAIRPWLVLESRLVFETWLLLRENTILYYCIIDWERQTDRPVERPARIWTWKYICQHSRQQRWPHVRLNKLSYCWRQTRQVLVVDTVRAPCKQTHHHSVKWTTHTNEPTANYTLSLVHHTSTNTYVAPCYSTGHIYLKRCHIRDE